jgi:uncharacterized protein
MKRLILALAALTCSVPALAADNFPAMNGSPVIDQADILGPIQKATIDGELRRIYKETHHQVAVLTLKDMGGQDPADYGVKALRHYKLGSKERNDGVLLIVSMSNPRRLQIAVGYGLEGELTDAKSVEITESMKSYMRNGYPGTAILTGISGIEKQITKEVVTAQQVATSDKRRAAEQNGSDSAGFVLLLFLGALAGGSILVLIFSIRNERKEAAEREAQYEEARKAVAKDRPKAEEIVRQHTTYRPTVPIKPVPTIPAPKSTYSPPPPPPAPSYDDSWMRSSPPPSPPSYDWGSSSGSSSSDSFSGDGGSGGGGGGGSDW